MLREVYMCFVMVGIDDTGCRPHRGSRGYRAGGKLAWCSTYGNGTCARAGRPDIWLQLVLRPNISEADHKGMR